MKRMKTDTSQNRLSDVINNKNDLLNKPQRSESA